MPEWITKYWLEWVFGLMVAGLTFVTRTLAARLKKQQQENEALRNGMRSLLKAQIVSTCERCMESGWCGSQMRDTITDMYESYHALGGNGTATSLVKQTMELPAVNPEKGDKQHD